MATQNLQKRPVTRWTALREWTPTVVFLLVAVLVECLVVLLAISLGAEDASLLQWSFLFPGTGWNVTLAISPLFHLVPIAGIIALVFSWMYLTRQMAMRPSQTWRGKVGPASKKAKTSHTLSQFFKKLRTMRPTAKSALMLLLIFAFFILIISLLTYPQAIYRTVSGAYQNNPSLLGFVRGTSEALAPVGAALSAINGAFLYMAPGFRDFIIGLGNTIKPLSTLDGAGKFLVFQNAAAWISVLIALFYVEFVQKGYRYVKK